MERVVTDGKIKQVETISENGDDVIYIVVSRDGKRYLEKLAFDMLSSRPIDYVMLDCSTIFTDSDKTRN